MKRILSILFFFFTGSLHAQIVEEWYKNIGKLAGIDQNAGLTSMLTLVIPPGGLYQAMGTAYTAFLKDAGYIEANPAGSSILEETILSLSHNDWIGESRLESIVFSIRTGQLGFGLGGKLLYIPFTAINSWGDRYQKIQDSGYAKGYYTEFVATFNTAYTFFDNYFSSVTLGCNAKLAARGVPEVIAQNQSAVTGMVDLGVVTQFNFLKFYSSRNRNTLVGFSLRNIGAPVMDDPLPSMATLGFAYSPVRPLTLTTDIKVPFLIGKDASQAEKISYAIGVNVVVANTWSVQAGLELKPGRPRLSLGSQVNIEQLTISATYLVDLATSLQPFDRISIAFQLNLGDLGRREAETRAHEFYLSGLELYARGNLHEAIVHWKQALDLLPIFQPAKDMTYTAQKAIELQQEMESKQKIEQ